jgi:hypothetical protein
MSKYEATKCEGPIIEPMSFEESERIHQSMSKTILGSAEDFNRLMRFFAQATQAYAELAGRKKIEGKEEAFKFYAGMVDGLRLAQQTIIEFEEKTFLDPLT